MSKENEIPKCTCGDEPQEYMLKSKGTPIPLSEPYSAEYNYTLPPVIPIEIHKYHWFEVYTHYLLRFFWIKSTIINEELHAKTKDL